MKFSGGGRVSDDDDDGGHLLSGSVYSNCAGMGSGVS